MHGLCKSGQTVTGRSSFGHVRERPDRGNWQALYQDRAGRQHTKTFPTKAQAHKWLRDESTARDRGSWVDPVAGKVTFRTWSARWRTTLVGLRESTQVRDLGYLDRYMLPTFGAAPLAEIDHLAVTAWVARMDRDHAAATVVKAAQIMGKIMRAAVAAKVITSSPCDGIKLPRIEREEMRFLSADEVWTLAGCMDERYRAAVLLAAFSGLRAGELFGLKTERVNPLRRTVDVVEIVTEVGGRSVVGPPKTRAGRRTVPIPGFVAEALVPHLTAPLVFPSPNGGYVSLSSWRTRFWRPATAAAGLSGFRIHDLRHTAVALWIEAGATPVEIAKRAGHSSTVTVLDRYGHRLPGAEDRVTDALDAMGRRSSPSPALDRQLLRLDDHRG